MSFTKTFAVIGGDARSLYMIDILKKHGHNVLIYALERQIDSSVNIIGDLNHDLHKVDYIILPTPISKDDKLHAPFCNKEYYLEEILNLIPPAKTVFAGSIAEKYMQRAIFNKFTLIDILKREELLLLNGIPTAEGAIQIAMEELAITIHDCNSLVLGYGNIGKVLCNILKGLGAKVTATARKPKDLAMIKSNNLSALPTQNIKDSLNNFDLIINTIPSLILGENELLEISDKCLIIDLSSKPGGVDFKTAQLLSKKVIWALSLPGKVAPQTAANSILDTIFNIIREEEHI